jgi:hypothetical protein
MRKRNFKTDESSGYNLDTVARTEQQDVNDVTPEVLIQDKL